MPKSTTFDHELAFDGGRKRVVKMRMNGEGYDKLMQAKSMLRVKSLDQKRFQGNKRIDIRANNQRGWR